MSDQQTPGPGQENRTPGLIVGVVLVFIGLWLLGNTATDRFGPWLRPLLAMIRELRIWAVAGGLILIGVLVIVYSGKVSLKLPSKDRPLRRSREKKMISGVLGGLSDYLDVDVTLLRLVVVALAIIMNGWGIVLAYIIAAIVIPMEPEQTSPPTYVQSQPPVPPQQ